MKSESSKTVEVLAALRSACDTIATCYDHREELEIDHVIELKTALDEYLEHKREFANLLNKK